jgi:CubicO group peptidase (beta-lactamase class C family)
MLRPAISLVLMLLAGLPQAYAQPADLSAIDSMMAFLNDGKSPGCFIGVIQNGKVIYEKGFGFADIEKKIVPKAKTNFHIGSNSKQFTAMCIMMLASEGKLKRTDDIHKFIPELPDYGVVITIDHLLSHTSGIRDWLELNQLLCNTKSSKDRMYPLTLIQSQKNLNFAPGKNSLYSNSNFFLLGLIVERVSKMSLHSYIRKKIFEPLAMNNSFFSEEKNVMNASTGYSKHNTAWTPDKQERRGFYGEGGIISNFKDIALWLGCYYNASPNNKFKDLFREMEKPVTKPDLSVGSGLFVRNFLGKKIVYHGGNTRGFSTQWLHIPELQLDICCLANSAAFPYDKYCSLMACLFIRNDSARKILGVTQQEQKIADKFHGYYFDSTNAQLREIGTTVKGVFCKPVLFEPGIQSFDITYDWGSKVCQIFKDTLNEIKLVRKSEWFEHKFIQLKKDSLKKEYCGKYFCPELNNLSFELLKDDKGYYFKVKNKYIASIDKTFGDRCIVNSFDAFIKFRQDRTGKVNSFELSTDRIKRLEFIRK